MNHLDYLKHSDVHARIGYDAHRGREQASVEREHALVLADTVGRVEDAPVRLGRGRGQPRAYGVQRVQQTLRGRPGAAAGQQVSIADPEGQERRQEQQQVSRSV